MARPKKKNNTRTDAALDAMRPYGFADDLILRHLKQLLEVYGEDHWFFIEENAYKVLLDSILEQVEQDTIPQFVYQEVHQGDIGAGPSREVLALPHSDTQTSDIAPQTREGPESASQFNGGCDIALLTCQPDGGNGHLSPTGQGTGSNQINLDQNFVEKQMIAVIEGSGVDRIENTNLSPVHASATQSPQATEGLKIRRRRPYHGWIDSDEEDGEVDLVELEPMPLPPELARLLSEARSKKRKTRWDLRPGNMI
ncbi:hypothetical protein ACOSQ4_032480 [Xanthoceras sorbifolium]